MGIYVPWLVDAAKLTGYPVVEVGGWRNRGHGGMRVIEGVVGHHTANPQSGEYPSLRIVRDGRGDLAGPLAQFGLGRSGTIYVIAAGLSWHAGASRWAGFTDLGDEFLGIEAESSGVEDDWTDAQRDCYPRLVASLLFYMRRDASRFGFHKEVCRPLGRKIDAAFWNGKEMRDRVAWLLQDPTHRIPRFSNLPTPTIPQTRKLPELMNDYFLSGEGHLHINVSVGKSSSVVKRAWVVASPKNGVANFSVYAQGDKAGIEDWKWEGLQVRDGLSDRRYKELPDGTTQLQIHYKMTGEATVTLELMPH